MAEFPPRSQHADLAQKTTPGEVAADLALRCIDYGEAPRVIFLGDSRCGKTHAMRMFVRAYLRKAPNAVVLIVDDKESKPQFEGQYFRDVADLDTPGRLEPNGSRVLVFRGDGKSLQSVDAESVCRRQLEIVNLPKRRPCLVVYDELDRAAANGQWKAGKDSVIGWAFGKGGSQGAASFAGTQETEDLPRQPFNQSTHIVCVRMTGNPVRLLKQRNYLIGGVEPILPMLPGSELPPSERGYFVMLERGRPWDRRVYRFAGK
jgi:hypothetical protein